MQNSCLARVCEAYVLMLPPGVVTLPDEGFEYVEGVLVSK